MSQPFDMSKVQRGARLRRSPYYDAEQKFGPLGYTVYNHMLFPIRFDTFENEFDALLNGVTLWDVSVERCVEIDGPDGFKLTQLMTPRDLSKCAVGQAKYVLICAKDGGILNDPVLTRMGENKFWLALASSDVLFYAKGLADAYGLDVTVTEADVSPLQVQGPKSKDLMVDLFGEKVLGIKYYWFIETDLDGIPVVITRTGWTSEVGYEIYLTDRKRGTELYERIMDAGKKHGIRPTGPVDMRRVEGAIYNWGADMTWKNNPLEITGLERLVDWDLPDDAVLSLPALRRIKERGISKKLVGIEISGDPLPELNSTKWGVFKDGNKIGKVTSAIYSPRLKKNIGFAWVPLELAELGSKVDVRTPHGEATAQVVETPFVDPSKEIPKS
ncbi:MAG: glycine cleavage T C-terminal barrel domain-containing protein [Actinomycetota bacterium]